MDREDIRNKIRKQLGETTASFWTDSEINLWINDSIRDIAWRTKCLRKNAYMTPVASQAEYALSSYFSDIKFMLEFYHKNEGTTWRKLKQISRSELDVDYQGWLSASAAAPDKYAYDIEEDWLLIWPAPNSTNASTNYIRAYYVYEPTDLDDDADVPQIPDVLHDVIVEGVKVTAYESRGLGDRANNSRGVYINAIKDYLVHRDLEDDENITMRNYRNV